MKTINDRVKYFNFILASASPRRSELLKNLDIDFTVGKIGDVDESYPDSMPAKEVAAYISQNKAKAFKANDLERDIIITADTTVILDGKIYGKPSSEQDAKRMLTELSGKRHMVITGVTLGYKDRYHSFSEITIVDMAALSATEIDYYVQKYSPLDKAGAYGIQEWIGYIGVDGIQGCYYNVMGFPASRFYRELNLFINSL